jgi:hypothetical protein
VNTLHRVVRFRQEAESLMPASDPHVSLLSSFPSVGVIASLLKQQREESQGIGTSVSHSVQRTSRSVRVSIALQFSHVNRDPHFHLLLQDWSLEELCGVCAIMKVCNLRFG